MTAAANYAQRIWRWRQQVLLLQRQLWRKIANITTSAARWQRRIAGNGAAALKNGDQLTHVAKL